MSETGPQHRRVLRLALVALLLLALFAVGRYTGIAEDWDTERVREVVRGAGAWGWMLYLAVFAGGEFMHIPGIVFVLAGMCQN